MPGLLAGVAGDAMTIERCCFLTCREPAARDESELLRVALCFGHRVMLANEIVVKRAAPHLTPDGAFYVGDLNELLLRPAS